MKLLLLMPDMAYYDYKGELVFVKTVVPYKQPTSKEVLKQLKQQRVV